MKSVPRRRLLFGIGLIMLAALINLGPILADRLGETRQAGLSVWGANNFGQTGTGSMRYEATRPFDTQPKMAGTRQVALGLNHTLALTEDGEVYGWGSNMFGQLGQSMALKIRSEPVRIKGLPKIQQIAARQDHSMALAADGSVWTWGLNMSGQLGDGTNDDSNIPKKLKGVSNIQQIAAGYRMSLALARDGSLYAWGADCRMDTLRDDSFRSAVASLSIDGEYSTPATAGAKTGSYTALSPEEDCINEDVVGIKSVVPKLVEGLPRLAKVDAGFGHILALDESGQVWAWGCNTYAQIGNGTVGRGQGANLKPAKVKGMGGAVAISAGFRHSLVLKEDGSLHAWGHNFSGALGTGVKEDQHASPVQVRGVPKLATISAGHDFSAAVSQEGKVYGWGNGSAWQLSEKPGQVARPQLVWNLNDVDTVVAGGGHIAAIRRGVAE